MKITLAVILTAGLTILLYTQITIFIVPPIGAIPEGKTVILWRYKMKSNGQIQGMKLNFLDTADAVCQRLTHSVNLFCRAMALGMLAENTTILFRLPYSATLQSLAEI